MGTVKPVMVEGDDRLEPAPYCEVSEPARLKAFTDPLRIRVLNLLSHREATNQQIADTLGESTAKVLYHVRFLSDAGLIRLIRTEIKGGNVEKYYRAVAQAFILSPARDGLPEYELGATTAVLDAVRQETIASLARWPEQDSLIERHPGSLDPERMNEFRARLADLLDEYWTKGGLPEPVQGDENVSSLRWRLLVAVYRDPTSEE